MKKRLKLTNELIALKNELSLLKTLITELISAQNPQNEVLNVEDVSLLTGYAAGTIYQLVHKNQIPHHKRQHGGKLMFFKAEIIEWLHLRKKETPDDFITRKETELFSSHQKGGAE